MQGKHTLIINVVFSKKAHGCKWIWEHIQKLYLRHNFKKRNITFIVVLHFSHLLYWILKEWYLFPFLTQKTNSWATQIPLKAGVDYISTTKWVRMILLNIVQSNTIQQNKCQIEWERERDKNNTKYHNVETAPKSNRKIVEKSLNTIIFT